MVDGTWAARTTYRTSPITDKSWPRDDQSRLWVAHTAPHLSWFSLKASFRAGFEEGAGSWKEAKRVRRGRTSEEAF